MTDNEIKLFKHLIEEEQLTTLLYNRYSWHDLSGRPVDINDYVFSGPHFGSCYLYVRKMFNVSKSSFEYTVTLKLRTQNGKELTLDLNTLCPLVEELEDKLQREFMVQSSIEDVLKELKGEYNGKKTVRKRVH